MTSTIKGAMMRIKLDAQRTLEVIRTVNAFVGNSDEDLISIVLEDDRNIYISANNQRAAMQLHTKGDILNPPKKNEAQGMTFYVYSLTRLLTGRKTITLSLTNNKVRFASESSSTKMQGHLFCLEYEDVTVNLEENDDTYVIGMTAEGSLRLNQLLSYVALRTSPSTSKGESFPPLHIKVSENGNLELLCFDRIHSFYVQDKKSTIVKNAVGPAELTISSGVLESIGTVATGKYKLGISREVIWAKGAGFKLHYIGIQTSGDKTAAQMKSLMLRVQKEAKKDKRDLKIHKETLDLLFDNLMALDDGNSTAAVREKDGYALFNNTTKFGELKLKQRIKLKGWKTKDEFFFNQNIVRDLLNSALYDELTLTFVPRSPPVCCIEQESDDGIKQVLICSLLQKKVTEVEEEGENEEEDE